jgi:hypothetical protein
MATFNKINIFSLMNRRITQMFLLSILISLCICFFLNFEPTTSRYYFEITITTPKEGMAQIFYDTGKGYNEQNSSQHAVRASDKPQVLYFEIPPGRYTKLRIDPLNSAAKVILENPRVLNLHMRSVRELDFQDVTSKHDIGRLFASDGKLTIDIETGANDPFFELGCSPEINLGKQQNATRQIGYFLLILITIFVLLLFFASSQSLRNSATCAYVFMASLIMLKLWLASAQTLWAIGSAEHDDQLFINQAAYLLEGNWLGSYSQFTLMKGSFYSIFLAFVFLLGIPLFLSIQVLYAAACLLFYRALNSLLALKHRLIVFSILLFNPITYDNLTSVRVMRQNLLPSLVLILLACTIGLYANRDKAYRSFLGWGILGGLTMAAFWLTREEGIWLIPCLFMALLYVAISLWREKLIDYKIRLSLLIVPLVVWAAGVGIVSVINYDHYGVLTTCEFRHSAFKDAYGALLRVKPKQPIAQVPVTKETRQMLYDISPVFAELRPYMEGNIGKTWADISTQQMLPYKGHETEIKGGWFMWALRDTVVASGNAENAKNAMDFYRRMADEINRACENGTIEAGPRKTGFMPSLTVQDWKHLPGAFGEGFHYLLSFQDLHDHIGSPGSIGTEEQLKHFYDITRQRLSPSNGIAGITPKQRWLDGIRLHVMDVIGKIYSLLVPWCFGISLIACCFILVRDLFFKKILPSFLTIFCISMLLSICVLVTVLALIAVTSFPSYNTSYLAGCYSMIIIFILFAVIQGISIMKKKKVED